MSAGTKVVTLHIQQSERSLANFKWWSSFYSAIQWHLQGFLHDACASEPKSQMALLWNLCFPGLAEILRKYDQGWAIDWVGCITVGSHTSPLKEGTDVCPCVWQVVSCQPYSDAFTITYGCIGENTSKDSKMLY